MRKTLFIALSSLLVICSCSKSGSSSSGCQKTVAGISGIYKIVSIEAKVLGSYVDVTNTVLANPCQQDDKFELKTDKSIIYTDAGTVCSPTPGNTTGSWDVVGNTISLNVSTLPIPNISANISSYNCTTLVATFTSAITGVSTDYRITITKL